ncbi:MAG TPA: anti-sigma factor antagonist [Firmicutes bacterium]|nr:anti-sigma factor antagonist [Bacillota bacterium]
MALTIGESTIGDILVLEMSGFVDTSTCPVLDAGIKKVIGENKYKIVLDLGKIEFISSAGWGVFVSALKRIRTEGGDLKLAAMIDKVESVFKLMEFDSLLDAYPDVDEAVKSFSTG